MWQRTVIAGALLWVPQGCGPQLGPPDLVSGYYRVQDWELEESRPGAGGLLPERYEAKYGDPVPVRAGEGRLEVAQDTPIAHVDPSEPSVAHIGSGWRMLPLVWREWGYERRETTTLDNCEPYDFSWFASALDEETLLLTREGTWCGEDSSLEMELALVHACEAPCEFVDDRGETFPPVGKVENFAFSLSRCVC